MQDWTDRGLGERVEQKDLFLGKVELLDLESSEFGPRVPKPCLLRRGWLCVRPCLSTEGGSGEVLGR
jgi:hypothetical protein